MDSGVRVGITQIPRVTSKPGFCTRDALFLFLVSRGGTCRSVVFFGNLYRAEIDSAHPRRHWTAPVCGHPPAEEPPRPPTQTTSHSTSPSLFVHWHSSASLHATETLRRRSSFVTRERVRHAEGVNHRRRVLLSRLYDSNRSCTDERLFLDFVARFTVSCNSKPSVAYMVDDLSPIIQGK